MIVLICLVLFILYSLCEGIREAFYFHYKMETTTSVNIMDEHGLFAVQRGIMLVALSIISILYVDDYKFLYGIGTFLTCSLAFSFFHNGIYYTVRNNLNENLYEDKWLDQSYTTTAKFSFNFTVRIIMFICSLIITSLFIFL